MLEAIGSEWIYMVAGLFLGLLAGAGFFYSRLVRLERQNAELTAQVKAEKAALEMAGSALDHRFKTTAQEALKATSENFLQLAREKLSAAQKDSAHDLEKRQKAIDEMIKPVQEHLKSLSGQLEQVKGTDLSLKEEIKTLNRETARLVGALRDPAAQGRWGEYILEGLLEKSGLIKGVHYETQVTLKTESGRQVPDAIINLQDGFHIIVDAKAPVNEFANRLSEDLSEEQYKELMTGLARQVKTHVTELSRKSYWENDISTADFTVLFLPSEHLYSLALRADPGLVDTAAGQNIIIASPTLLMSLLRVVGMSWRQVELAKNAQDISALGAELYERISVFAGHMERVGKGIGGAMESYNKAVSSLESRVLVSARKFEDLQAAPRGKEIPALEPQETDMKALDAPEKKRA